MDRRGQANSKLGNLEICSPSLVETLSKRDPVIGSLSVRPNSRGELSDSGKTDAYRSNRCSSVNPSLGGRLLAGWPNNTRP